MNSATPGPTPRDVTSTVFWDGEPIACCAGRWGWYRCDHGEEMGHYVDALVGDEPCKRVPQSVMYSLVELCW